MTQPEFDPEELAAFIDGRLSGDDRARIVKLLAESETAFEVFAETLRSQGDPQVIPIRRPHPPRPWMKPGLAAAAIALFFLGIWTFNSGNQPAPLAFSAAQLVPQLTERSDIAAALGEGWDQPGWTTTRGGASRLVEPEQAFRLGVRAIDVRVALHMDDETAAARLLSEMLESMSTIEFSQPIVAPYTALQDSLRSTGLPSSAVADADVAERALDAFLNSDRVALGKWWETARLAVLLRDSAFFVAERTSGFLGSIDRYDPFALALEIEHLRRVAEITSDGIDEGDYAELQTIVEDAMKRNGG